MKRRGSFSGCLTFRLLAVLAVLLTTSIFWPGGSALAQPAPETQLDNVERELRRQRQQNRELDAKAQGLARTLGALRRDLVATAGSIHEHEAQLSRIEALLPRLARDEAAKRRKLLERREQFVQVLMALQRMARYPPEAFLSQPLSPNDTVRGAILLRAAVPEIDRRAARLREDLDALAAVRLETETKRAALAAATRGHREQQARLEGLLARKRSILDETLSAGGEAGQRIEALGRQARDLKDLMARLETERLRRQRLEAERLEAERRALEVAVRRAAAKRRAEAQAQAKAKAQAKAQAKTQAKAQAKAQAEAEAEARAKRQAEARIKAEAAARAEEKQTADASKPWAARPISQARGRLFYPVVGRLVGRYGQATDGGLSRKGITIETRVGAQVVAPFDGIVAFAGPFRGYGRLLIIEHGEGYHTLLAGLERIQAVIGQRLASGEPVGVMGNAENGKPALYIELRRDGQPINPQPWLAAGKDKVSG